MYLSAPLASDTRVRFSAPSQTRCLLLQRGTIKSKDIKKTIMPHGQFNQNMTIQFIPSLWFI
jgi:hypothetical protein